MGEDRAKFTQFLPVVKIHRRGQAMGGIITGIRNNLREGKVAKREHRDIQERRVNLENKMWRIYTVYVRGNVEDIKQDVLIRIGNKERM